jgi:UDP-N-acetylglucosamine transferase subunit ALG13
LIFVCTGSRDYQFNRLIEELDRLVAAGEITDEIFAQIGDSNPPKHFPYERFVERKRFAQLQRDADLIISHAGTGALVGALKLGKKVIAVPRLAKYGEHIDDHQTQIAGVLAQEGYLKQVTEIGDLAAVIHSFQNDSMIKSFLSESNVIKLIEEFLCS